MIYCSSLNLIFLKTKKVGGTSFEIALSKYCNEKDIVTPISTEDELTREKLGYQAPVNFLDEDRCDELVAENVRGSFYNHMTGEEIYRNLGEKIFNRCTKISIHREPLDFLVSLYFFQRRNPKIKDLSFGEWLPARYEQVQENYEIAPLSGPYSPDIVLSYETLSDEVAQLNELPRDFADTFNALKAKGSYRPKSSRDAQAFFGVWVRRVYPENTQTH